MTATPTRARTPLRAAVLLVVAVLAWWATAVRPASAQQPDQPLARLELATLAPRVVTAAGPSVLTVTGEVLNTGDRTISDLAVRVQRDPPLADDATARAALEGSPDAPFVTEFTGLATELAPGQRIPFRIDVPLGAGPDLRALQITEPGVYPLLVNLNGTPDFGGAARLAAVPLLLPVLGVPSPAPGEPAGRPVAPAPLTVVWPLATEPVRLLSGPGEPLLLAAATPGGDPIARQLAPGGRLDGLLGALEEVVVPGSPLAGGLCVAVDPALLETVREMATGYRVTTPGGIVDGTGTADAQRWLDRLRAVVAGRCVLPLPYGDPDLVALSRAGLTDLEALAASTGVRVVGDVLGVQPLTGLVWPADGVLDERTLMDLTALDMRAVLLEPRGILQPPVDTDTVQLAGGTRGLLADPLLTTALSPAPPLPLTGPADHPLDGTGTAASIRLTGTDRPLAAQDAVGTLAYRALTDDRRPVLLLPPRRWQVGGAEGAALLRTAEQLVTAGYLVPRDLPGLVGATPAAPPAAPSAASDGATLDYPAQVGAREIPPAVTARVTQARDVLRDLEVATERDATVDLEPVTLLEPLRLALLRGLSSAWRDEPARAAELVAGVSARLDELRRSVRIAAPPGPYMLASSDSPLLVTVQNDLPVSVDVRLELADTPGLRTGVVGVVQVPARSNRQLVIPAEVSRTGQFSVDARLSTPGGTPLGEPSTLQLQSTVFGSMTVALTAGAGAVLVLLVTRRIVRRVRAGRAAR